MALKKNTSKNDTNKKPSKSRTAKKPSTPFFKRDSVQFITGVLLCFFGIFLFISLFSFFFTGMADQSKVENLAFSQLIDTDNEIENWAGAFGAYLANMMINNWVGLSAFIFTAWLCIVGLRLMKVNHANMWRTTIYCALAAIIVSLLFGFLFQLTGVDTFLTWGGNHGYVATQFLHSIIGSWGTGLILATLLIVLLVMISRSTIDFIRTMLQTNPFKREPKPQPTEEPAEDETIDDEETDDAPDDNLIPEVPATGEIDGFTMLLPDEREETSQTVELDPVIEPIPLPDAPQEIAITIAPTVKEEELKKVIVEDYDPTLDLPRYRKPHLDLLAKLPDITTGVDRDELESNKQRIIETLTNYDIKISSIQATIGPTVTLYEIVPAPGVRIAKIKNLEDDIALSLKALGIRIIAPIPGKGTIGIEVPNNDPQTVSMRSIIASRKFQESKYELPIALGKTITNEVYITDLTKMPHVLVAGATGQGKSVGLNAIITSLLYKKHPAELKFVLIDPKKVEFSIYSVIERHFLAKLPETEEPIITDTSRVVQTLQSVTHEMDMRYDLLKAAHVRNIKEYNAKFKARHLLPSKGHKYLPYIVVIIDEFSDLIMTAGKEVENPIIRIAQLARAVGIHMIIATQRPSTNVITGIIKANFPARIAFRVMQMVDSRTILDCPGANQLIGRGDMLISLGGDTTRVQCAFVDTPEVETICKYISEQQSFPEAFMLPEYVAPDSEGGNEGGGSFDSKDRDPLFEEAARIIVSSQQASTSSLQRRYSIGYNRAGRLMDQLEAAGIVGAAIGGKPREVLIMDMMQLENKLDTMK